MSYELSILDQSPVQKDQTNVDALQQTIALAQLAERLGYTRFLVSEHHNLAGLIGTSPEVLVSHLLAKTSHICIGSGGIMLQHYSPFKVAENFNVLATLAPGRVDLGVGKTSGALPDSTKALQKNFKEDVTNFDERFAELYEYIHPNENTLLATPIPPIAPNIILLGASEQSAAVAADLDISYAFARFINTNEEALARVAKILEPRKRGKFIVSLTVLATEDGEDARAIAATHKIAKIYFESGKVVMLQTLELAKAFVAQSDERYEIKTFDANIIAGTPQEIKSKLDDLHVRFGVDEFILHTPVFDGSKRMKSFELLSPANLFSEIKIPV
ncbi:MAG: MsnO8 family LLM class oxidoreductase [Solibacillus sp.]